MTNQHDNPRNLNCSKLHGVFFVLFLSTLIFGLSGCHADQPSMLAKVEKCGSNTIKGTYYDFRSDTCVVPAQDDFKILFDYAQLVRIAAVASSSIPFYITFAEDASLDDVRTFFTAATPDEYQNVVLFLPAIGHGMRAGRPVPIKTASLVEALRAIKTNLLASYDDRQTDLGKSIRDGLISSFEVENYRIIEVKIVARPDSMLRAWEKHYRVVQAIQPRSSPISWPNESQDFFK